MITFKDQSLLINNEKIYPFGAEIHYFRVPKDQWRQSIMKAKEAGMNMISTYIPWSFHEYKERAYDFNGETKSERDLITFLTLIKEANMYCLVRPGPYNMAELVDHGIPTWLLDSYPEIIARDISGLHHETRVVSYNHPLYLEKVRLWYKQVNRVISDFLEGAPVIAYQLDNEVGMFHWVTEKGDFSSVVWNFFKTFAKDCLTSKAYNNLISSTLGNKYEDISTVMENSEIELAYQKFMRHYFYNYLLTLQRMAIEDGINVPFVVNIHGFHEIDVLGSGTMYPIGLSQLLKVSELENTMLAGDYYIGNIHYDNYTDIVLANAFTSSIQAKHQPLFSAEFQGGKAKDVPRLQPTTFDLTTKLCISNGMNAVNYYMFQSGINSKEYGLLGERHEWQAPVKLNGETRSQYETISKIGHTIETFQEELLQTKPYHDLTIGFYPDYYGINYKGNKKLSIFESFQKQSDQYLYKGMVKGLKYNNINFNAINVQREERLDPNQIPILWMFSLKRMAKSVQEKLLNYVERGGQLFLYPQIPEEDLIGQPCTVLKQAFIIRKVKETKSFVELDDIQSIECDKVEHYSSKSDVFCKTDQGYACGLSQNYGKGKMLILGAHMQLNFNYKKDVFRKVAVLMGVQPRLEVTDDVDSALRVIDKDAYFIHLHNFDHYDKYPEIIVDDVVVYQQGNIKVPALKGLMLPINITLDNQIKIISSTVEIISNNVEKGQKVLTADRKLVEEFMVIELSYGEIVEQHGVNIQKKNGQYFVTLAETFNDTSKIILQQCSPHKSE